MPASLAACEHSSSAQPVEHCPGALCEGKGMLQLVVVRQHCYKYLEHESSRRVNARDESAPLNTVFQGKAKEI